MPNYYIQTLGGDRKVNRCVSLAGAHQGTWLGGEALIFGRYSQARPQFDALAAPFTATATMQQKSNSEFMNAFTADGITRPGVKYTAIATRFDEYVVPFGNALTDEPGVENLILQDLAPGTQPSTTDSRTTTGDHAGEGSSGLRNRLAGGDWPKAALLPVRRHAGQT